MPVLFTQNCSASSFPIRKTMNQNDIRSSRTATTGRMATPHSLRWRSRIIAICGLVILLPIIMVFAMSVGSADYSFITIWKIILSQLPFIDLTDNFDVNELGRIEDAILQTRLPRVVLGGLVGSALAVAGATYQGLFRNPLADPYLIGVSQGALLGAVIGFLIAFGNQEISQFGPVPVFAFVGAIAAVLAVYFIARTGRSLPVTTLILAGVALGAALSAITQYLIIASGDSDLHSKVMLWMFGHIEDEWTKVLYTFPFMIVGTMIIWFYSRSLNVMQLDEEQAEQLGINVERVKVILLVCSTLVTAAAVAFCGTIGFVGIIIPHTVRLIWGPDHRFLLPLATLVGAIFLILADTLVRFARPFTGAEEIPIGVITAAIGAPFFLYLLRKKKRGTYF